MNEQETYNWLIKNGAREKDINRRHGSIIVEIWNGKKFQTPKIVIETIKAEGFTYSGGLPGLDESWSKIFTMPSVEEMMGW